MASEILPELRRLPTVGEEAANSISHGVGLVAALAGTPFLVAAAAATGRAELVVGASVFAAAMVLTYLASTVYHALPPENRKLKHLFFLLDHGAIFLLIAGTYTPFTLGVLSGVWGWFLLVSVWTLALAGIALKAAGRLQHRAASTGLYLAMGWLVLLVVWPLCARMPTPGLLWLLAGGLAYTAGVGFYLADRVRYAHLVWHLFVIAGTACHFVAVMHYAA